MSRSDEERIQDILEIAISLQILVAKGEGFFFEDITHQAFKTNFLTTLLT